MYEILCILKKTYVINFDIQATTVVAAEAMKGKLD
jgi:hypothetical protein